MSYVKTKVIDGNKYEYKITSYRDKVTKKVKSTSEYLGIRQKDGSICKKKDLPKFKPEDKNKTTNTVNAMDYGHIYMLETFARQSKLKESLEVIFGVEYAQDILSLVFFSIIEAKALHLYAIWRESCECDFLSELSSQRISELLRMIAKNSRKIQDFFAFFAHANGPISGVWLDITSISSYSKNNSFLEYGYNRDQEAIPQVNIGVLMSFPTHLPILYEIYPGSLNDVSTLHNIVLKTGTLNIPINTWVMDRGFFSAANINHMIKKGLNFIIGLPGQPKEYSRLIQTPMPFLADNVFKSGDKLFSFVEEKCNIGSHILRAVIYFQQHKYTTEYNALLTHVLMLEEQLMNAAITSSEELELWLDNHHKFKNLAQCLLFNFIENKIIIKRNQSHIMFLMNGKGKFILVSNSFTLTPQALLEQYKDKDRVEKIFHSLKNEIDSNRFKTHSSESMHGKMFINFSSLILRTFMLNKINAAKSNNIKEFAKIKQMTTQGILIDLRKIRRQLISDSSFIITEITARQRLLFKAFNVPLPS